VTARPLDRGEPRERGRGMPELGRRGEAPPPRRRRRVRGRLRTRRVRRARLARPAAGSVRQGVRGRPQNARARAATGGRRAGAGCWRPAGCRSWRRVRVRCRWVRRELGGRRAGWRKTAQ